MFLLSTNVWFAAEINQDYPDFAYKRFEILVKC